MRWRAKAEAAERAGAWAEALAAWREVNASGLARGSTLIAEARAALALGRAGQAESALRRATERDPANPEPWRLWLEILRVEDRPIDALRVGWAAVDAVSASDRPGVLRDLTLALLADLPDDQARKLLARWSEPQNQAEPAIDPNARVALLARMGSMPRADDPNRATRIAELTALLSRKPDHLAARETLVAALADAGEPEAGREVLDAWPGPEPERDARYWRLRGRWLLDYDREPEQAAAALSRALQTLPHDWKTRYRLARALRAAGREADAQRAAEDVGRVREALDPTRLGPQLARDLRAPSLEHRQSLQELADLCHRVGLTRLAQAWRAEAERASR